MFITEQVRDQLIDYIRRRPYFIFLIPVVIGILLFDNLKTDNEITLVEGEVIDRYDIIVRDSITCKNTTTYLFLLDNHTYKIPIELPDTVSNEIDNELGKEYPGTINALLVIGAGCPCSSVLVISIDSDTIYIAK